MKNDWKTIGMCEKLKSKLRDIVLTFCLFPWKEFLWAASTRNFYRK